MNAQRAALTLSIIACAPLACSSDGGESPTYPYENPSPSPYRPPTIAWQSALPDGQVPVNTTLPVLLQVADPDNPLESLVVTLSGQGRNFYEGPPDAAGLVSTSVTLDEGGTWTLSAVVRDPQGREATALAVVYVEQSFAPSVIIAAGPKALYPGDAVAVVGAVTDLDDLAPALTATWSFNFEEVLETQPTAGGLLTYVVTGLPYGTSHVGLVVEDPAGHKTQVDISLQTELCSDSDADGFYSCDVNKPSLDCDDDDASIHPGVAEICDGVDQDCDLRADEDFDGDSDGVAACAGDCDDADPARYPGAWEQCQDGFDQDCDGADGLCLPWSGIEGAAGAHLRLAGDSLHQLAGSFMGPVGDLNGDGNDDIALGFPESSLFGPLSGSVLIFTGHTIGHYDPSAAAGEIVGGAWSYTGFSMAQVPDVNADGDGEVAVGAPLAAGLTGVVYIHEGPIEGLRTPDSARAVLRGADGDTFFGSVISYVGDFDGDGRGDLAIAAATLDGAGRVYIVPADTAGDVSVREVATTTLVGQGAQTRFGAWLAGLGDTDGDGAADLAVGAPGDGGQEIPYGRVYVFKGGSRQGEVGANAAEGVIDGNLENSIGYNLSRAGDLTGDGLNDLVIEGLYLEGPDRAVVAAYVFDRPAAGRSTMADASATLITSAFSVLVLDGPGDVTGDGNDDLLLGEPAADAGGGLVRIFTGPVLGTRSSSTATRSWGAELGAQTLGICLASPGDVNGDGAADLFMGAPNGWVGTLQPQVGTAYVVFGGQDPSFDIPEAPPTPTP